MNEDKPYRPPAILGPNTLGNKPTALSSEEEIELQKYLAYLKTVKVEKIPKELTLEEIESIVNVYPNKPDSCYKFGAQWAKERSDAYWKHQISLLKEKSDKRLIEEVEKAFGAGRLNGAASFFELTIDTKEYLDSIKAKHGITL